MTGQPCFFLTQSFRVVFMLRKCALLAAILAPLLCGCLGQSKATGKYADQDKPKPSETTDK
jgi:hypothetical protein